ncbi:hypothetical protein G3A43_08510 [Paraburkholderia aspalathi]|nr:hypothetical protein [Paraburkholderia aspalathi]MBK3780298.1 hypothetical protein [Paraburkholderia aspalathi]
MWILITLFAVGSSYGPSDTGVAFQEFGSLRACKNAIVEMQKLKSQKTSQSDQMLGEIRTTCVPKEPVL